MRYYIEREQVVSNSFEKIRSIKHDLNYQLLYLKSRLEENTEKSLMELEDKLNFLIGEEFKGNLKIYTKNQGLNRLLNYKLQEASSKGIETDTKINVYNVHACQDTKLNFLVMNSFREFYAAA